MMWHQLLMVVASTGYGLLSAVLPLANAEAYVLTLQATDGMGRAGVVGVTAGQSVGKLLLFLAARHGRQFRFWHRKPGATSDKPVTRLGRLSKRSLFLLGTKRWGLPVVLLSAVVGVPPLYAVALLSGTTRMKSGWFLLAVAVGRFARFSVLALGAGVVLSHNS